MNRLQIDTQTDKTDKEILMETNFIYVDKMTWPYLQKQKINHTR